jgi:hypothetical protein
VATDSGELVFTWTDEAGKHQTATATITVT